MAAPRQPSTEARELELLKKVELRIALAESETKLETLLGTYLAPLLLKLESESSSVREKVIGVCKHINVRLQSQSIKLPVSALLKQVKEHRNSPLVRNFDLTFIQKGVPRLDAAAKAEALPVILHEISQDFNTSFDYASELFNLFLHLLQDYPIPARGSSQDDTLRSTLGLSDEDAGFVASWIGKFMLLRPLRHNENVTESSPPCPGLTTEEFKFLSLYGKRDAFDPSTPNGLNLTASKIKAVKLLASGLFRDEERFIPAICASSNANSDITSVAEDILKRASAAVSFEDPKILHQLYLLYSFRRPGAPVGIPSVPLKLRALSYLTRSSAIVDDPEMVEVIIAEGLYPDGQHELGDKSTGSQPQRELTKLRLATVKFATSSIRSAQARKSTFNPDRVIYYFMMVLKHQAWPRPDDNADVNLRRQAYEVIGSAAAVSVTSESAFVVLNFLLDSLVTDTSGAETALGIQEALLIMMRYFEVDKTNKETQERLVDLLIQHNMDLDEDSEPLEAAKIRSGRYIALRYANRCLPYHNLDARWIDILALGAGAAPEVLDEAQKGLDPYWFRSMNADSIAISALEGRTEATEEFLPRYEAFVQTVTKRLREISKRDELPDLASTHKVIHQLKTHCGPAMGPLLRYLRQLMLAEALRDADLLPDLKGADWAKKLDSALEGSLNAREGVRAYLRTAWIHGPESQYAIRVLFKLASEVAFSKAGEATAELASTFTELLTIAPDAILEQLNLQDDLPHLSQLIHSNDRLRRTSAAHAFGLIISLLRKTKTLSTAKVLDDLNQHLRQAEHWRDAVGATVNEIHGSIVATSYAISRMTYRGLGNEVKDSLTKNLALVLQVLQDSHDNTLKDASYTALGQLSAYNAITMPSVTKVAPIPTVITKLSEAARKGNERAILALGKFSLIFAERDGQDDANLDRIENALYALHEVRETETQFSVGEALSYLVCGWDSSALAPKHDIDGPLPTTPDRTPILARVFDRVISDCKASKPSLRRAAVIWLLCLVQFCGHRPEIKTQLRACQAAFKNCLSDREELVQEAASRGLGLVYEKGDRELKDDLVRDLVGSFTDNKAQLSGNVTEDTQLFDAGALPTGDGSITTYKDILSLAAEVGNPSLVYRFMSLAANNSIWSSRAAFGRFGLSSIFSDSSVDGYLSENPKLYPKLYRYRFDPNSNVRRSMQDIWNALVKDSSKTIERNFDSIMEDLLQNILGKEWRVRQASCDAIADLVQGRPFEQVEPYVGRIWTQCFKVLDDIKGSVREAAAGLARTLTGILIRALEAGEGAAKKADGMLKHVLPFLLSSSGLENSAEEVQFFALETLLQIIKKSSGKILRPYIPGLVEQLLTLFSSLENQIVNYLRLNASKYKVTEQKIDDMRLMAVRQSPLMEATERCLDLLDDPTMEQLAPKLENAIKTALGLPSQVACTRVLVSMSTRHNQLFRPYADRFLKLTERHLTDRNDTVAVSYAEAAGYVSRVASDEQILQLADTAKRFYFDAEDEKHRIAAGDLLHAVAKHATDRFAALGADILPFVFIAKHDSSDQVKELFQKAWDEGVGGSRAVLLYLKEIVALSQAHLDSPRWVLKHASARSIADAIDSVASSAEPMSLASAEIIWPALVKAMSGKTWEGKEVVLEAFVKFVEKGSKLWQAQTTVASEINKVNFKSLRLKNFGGS
ncbi:ARM repeat-containing protein [Rhizodiscina lignyota]|uniref:ARM repeat-containing protein n=1 Tax=Rhizodiscina lignyota TaxID=1504668 RepID=A0A9P4M5Y7_9PEZI|nr:ARM repeat-containing protein [Rhizodiscina lignyota]